MKGKPTLDTVITFLLGHGKLDGCKFGEIPEDQTSSLWWRQHLREAYGELGALDLLEVNTIAEEVADHYRLRRSVLHGALKNPSIVTARQVAMYLARPRTPHSLVEIGRCFNRDHTCVVQAVAKIKNQLAANPQTARDVNEIITRLEQQ